jgi:hypothetical protein
MQYSNAELWTEVDKVWGSHGSVAEVSDLLECYTVLLCERYLTLLKDGSSLISFGCLTLKMKVVCSFKTGKLSPNYIVSSPTSVEA